ncbi:MAG: cupin domain-containing protein [Pseudoxanthomonas suwonensis]|nr:cupin domain-containing protein [Pseudoxanthomonas suwonensis]
MMRASAFPSIGRPMTTAMPIEIDAGNGPAPLGMAPEEFLRDYWQKRPLLVRNAFPGFQSPVSPEDMAGLACEDGVLARIISHDRASDHYTLRTGPFDEAEFPGMPHQDWTLLVQDVDKWDTDIRALIDAFDFLPRWRIDDIMVSFAAPGGSVGAHVDQYDVFLLQAHGHRRWQIDARPHPDLAFRDDADIKLLRRFEPDHDWVLAPGDMLYLPPGVPHHGIAEDACLTFSLGMRAPAAAELMADFVDSLLEQSDESERYVDADLRRPADGWEIDQAALQRVATAMRRLRWDDPAALADWFGRFMTLYRSVTSHHVQPDDRGRPAIEAALDAGQWLARDPWTRVAWSRAGDGARLFVAGEAWSLPVDDARTLAANAHLHAGHYAALAPASREVVAELFASGRYRLQTDEGDDDHADAMSGARHAS